jgi:hypothetical protein
MEYRDVHHLLQSLRIISRTRVVTKHISSRWIWILETKSTEVFKVAWKGTDIRTNLFCLQFPRRTSRTRHFSSYHRSIFKKGETGLCMIVDIYNTVHQID